MSRGRLLILDDDPTVGQIIQLSAQAFGFEARHCTEPDGFMAALREAETTHVAIDLRLAETTGVEVLRQLAQAGCRARVIVCSGSGDSELHAALDEAGRLGLDCAGVLPKPFTLAALKALLGVVG